MTCALELRDVSMSFGALAIMKGVNLIIPEGERHAVIGPNGAGKSTLFHLISGRLKPTTGRIELFGQRIDSHSPYMIFRKGLARNFQVNSLFTSMSARENLRCAALLDGGIRSAFWRSTASLTGINQRVTKMLREIYLEERADLPCEQLAYSQQRALEIGMAVISGRKVILLDEPTAGMNHAETEHFVALVRRLTEGRTLVVVEHDMGVVFSLADRITVLAGGALVATDTPAAIRTNAAVRACYLGDHAPAEEKERTPC